MIPAKQFADTAYRAFLKGVPFRTGGKTLTGMDSAGFIEYCLEQNGVHKHFIGTNDMYRQMSDAKIIPLRQAQREKLIVPGVLLLHIANDGEEPDKYKHDGKGNCDYALIAKNSKVGLYPSRKKERLIETKIEPVSGKANYVMFCSYVNYDRVPSTPETVPSGENIAYTTTRLKLREEPTGKSPCITVMPNKAAVTILERKFGWARVKYVKKAGLYFDGWCATEYLSFK